MSVDPRFKLEYIQDPVQREVVQQKLLDYLTITYPLSLYLTSKPDKKRKRAYDISLHDFLPSIETTEGPIETVEEKLDKWFSSLTVFLSDDDNVLD